MKYILRLITLPFVAGIFTISFSTTLIIAFLVTLKNYMIHGIEIIPYSKRTNAKTIMDIYNLVEEKLK